MKPSPSMMRARLAGILVAIVLIVIVSVRLATPLDAGDGSIESCELLRDTAGTLDVSSAARSTEWQPLQSHHPNFGWTYDVIWLRLVVRNGGARPIEAALDGTREWVEEVDLYVLDGAGVRAKMHSGARVPMAARPIPTERILFPLSLAPAESRTLLVRLRSRGPIAFEGRIVERHTFDIERATEEVVYGAYYGVLLGLAAYSLILFWMMRDPTQLIVGLTLFSYMLGECTSHGHASRFVPQLAGWLELSGGAGTLGVSALFMLMLAQRLAGPRAALRRVLRATCWVILIASGAAIVFPLLHVVAFASFVGFGIVMVATIVIIQDEDPKRLYFGTAVGSFLVPVTIQLCLFFGFGFGFWPENANHLGAVGMAVLFSLLVGHTVFEQNRHISSLNMELKRQIADRAGQLVSAISRLSVAPRALEAGALVEDRYRVIRELGKGGMGAVYEVERLQDHKRLALKVLSGVADREALVRFAREAQIAAQLDHPNVVSVLDVDVSKSGMLFLVMELVAGNSLLAEKSNWGDREWARPILKQIAEALSAMHAKGIVHRDLKPANVLLDGKIVKVADFGIASLRPQTDGDSTITKGMTQTGAFMGTPIYMAPELVKGAREAQPSADVWSFGVLAHELLTGKLPFPEPPIVAKLEGRATRLSVENDLSRRCLVEDAAARPTAREMSEALA